jgi:hypothetical protein
VPRARRLERSMPRPGSTAALPGLRVEIVRGGRAFVKLIHTMIYSVARTA